MNNNNPYRMYKKASPALIATKAVVPYVAKSTSKLGWKIPVAIAGTTAVGAGGKYLYDKHKKDKEFSWDKIRPYAVPTIAGLGGMGISYGALGAIPAFRRNAVLRLLASGAIGAAAAGGAYYLDNVYGKDKGIMDTLKGWKDTIANKLS